MVTLLGAAACTSTPVPGVDAADSANLSPRFSPDGSRLVFSSDRDGNDEICVVGIDGRELARLTNDPAKDFDPSFSPDGPKIVFDSERDGPVAIFVMNKDGSAPVNVSLPTQPGDIFPAWSPDGSTIAFYREFGENAAIFLVDADWTHLVRLVG